MIAAGGGLGDSDGDLSQVKVARPRPPAPGPPAQAASIKAVSSGQAVRIQPVLPWRREGVCMESSFLSVMP